VEQVIHSRVIRSFRTTNVNHTVCHKKETGYSIGRSGSNSGIDVFALVCMSTCGILLTVTRCVATTYTKLYAVIGQCPTACAKILIF